jgi:tetratricopeptide (TPR) repeat protein
MDAARRTWAEWTERRWLQIALAVVLLLALAPTPRNSGLVLAVRQGATALGAGQPTQALGHFELALALEPEWSPLHRAAALAAVAAGDATAAARHLADVPASTSNDTVLRCADALTRLSTAPSAMPSPADLQRALACPGAASALDQLAAEWIEAGKIDTAEGLARTWTQAAPNDPIAWSWLGRLTAVRAPDEAMASIERSMTLDPAAGQRLQPLLAAAQGDESPDATAAEVGRAFLQEQDWSLAEAALERAVELAPDQARARAFLGLARERKSGEGLHDVEKALEMQPNDPAILTIHAALLRARGDPEQARDELLTAAELAPTDPAIAAELGATYTALGDLPSASAAFEQAARLAPDQPEFWLLLARFSVNQAVDLEGIGLPAARNAVALGAGEVSAWQTLGQIHSLLGNEWLADRALRRALALDPRDAETWYGIGVLRLASDDRTGAQQALHAVLVLDPGGTWAELARRALESASLP